MDLCEAREDVFYIADFVGANDSITEVVEEASLVDSNYTATYYPWVKTIDTITNRVIAVPPSTLLVGTYAQNDRLGAEWFAPAGLNRGGIQGAVQVMNRLTQSERDTLYEGKVNPIAAFPGQGISAFGQKTLQESSSALDRINVRRLLINLKKFVASTSRFLIFEQNTGQTRAKFLNTVNPYLESVQQRQGLYAFRVVMDETNNTPDVIDRNILQGSVFLQPAKTAEFIVIDFNILPTGATFSV
jgi:phage tail sheath protein FI